MKVRDALKLIEADGWKYKKQVGSHRHFVHMSKPGKVTIAGHPSDELPPKTLASIMKQAGLK
jgi:predicted RNA binding protein YcfA (HicA-like mRNA interferase family)